MMTMARREMAMTAITLLSLMVLVTAQAPSSTPAAPAPSPPITCQLPSSSMVSSNFCNAQDQQSMETQTQGCTAYLTDIESTPSQACCTGLNEVAYNRTACICMTTFYPPSSHNASRHLGLPGLCSVQTNLCSQCPAFLISRSNGTAASPIYVPYQEGKSMASTIGAITLAVVFGLLLLAGIVGLTLTLIKKRRAKNNPPGPFEAAPPGGAF